MFAADSGPLTADWCGDRAQEDVHVARVRAAVAGPSPPGAVMATSFFSVVVDIENANRRTGLVARVDTEECRWGEEWDLPA